MQLIERSYNTKFFRPKPMIHWELDNQLLILATNWGSLDSAQKAIQEITKYITASQGDVEVTTPFEFLPQLTTQANALRISCLLANELIFRTDNRNDFLGGLEICIIYKNKSQLCWLQVGQPHIYFKRKNSNLQPLSIVTDLSFDIQTQSKNTLSPLPKELLGIDSVISPHIGHCLVQPEDELVVVSRSETPVNLNSTKSENINLADLTSTLSQENQNSPFWIGLLKLS